MPRFNIKISFFSTMLFFALFSFCLPSGNLTKFLLVLAALSIHEISHILCSELLGYQVFELRLTAIGGSLKVDPLFEINPSAESTIAAAGPVANLLMVGGVIYLNFLGISNYFLACWFQINLLLAMVNLIPALPLDGGRLLHACLNHYLGLETSASLSKTIACIIAILFLILGFVKILTWQAGTLFILTGFFIIFQLIWLKNPQLDKNWQLLQQKKQKLKKKGFLPIKSLWVDSTTFVRIPLQYYGSGDNLIFFLLDKEQKIHIISEDTAWDNLIKNGFNATFGQTIRPTDNTTCRIPIDTVE